MDEQGDWSLLMIPVVVCLALLVVALTVGAFGATQQSSDDGPRAGCISRTGPVELGCRR